MSAMLERVSEAAIRHAEPLHHILRAFSHPLLEQGMMKSH